MSEKVRFQLLLKAANWDLSVNCLLYCYCPLLNPVIAALPLNVTSSIVKFKVHFHFLNVYNIVKVKINSHFYHHFVLIFSFIFPEKNKNIFLSVSSNETVSCFETRTGNTNQISKGEAQKVAVNSRERSSQINSR